MESRNFTAMESRSRIRPHRPIPRLGRSRFVLAAVWIVGALLAGCGGNVPATGDAIPTEAFIEAMVALRTSPMMGSSGYLPAGEPERILGERELAPEDLRRFVEVHGSNVPMMTDVWTEVEARVAEARGITEPGN